MTLKCAFSGIRYFQKQATYEINICITAVYDYISAQAPTCLSF